MRPLTRSSNEKGPGSFPQGDHSSDRIRGGRRLGAPGPGTWLGAVADMTGDLSPVAVHEVGHALGLANSMTTPALSDAPLGKRYDAWIHLRGGVRGLQIRVAAADLAAQLPPGLALKLEPDNRTTADAVNGNAFLSLRGTPTRVGAYLLKIPIVDRLSAIGTVTLTLRVGTGVGLAKRRGTVAKRALTETGTDALGRQPREADRKRKGGEGNILP